MEQKPGSQRTRQGILSSLVALALLGTLTAGAATWTATSNGNWHDSGNWSGGVPNGTGAAADFTADLTADLTVTLDSAATVGNMTVADGASTYFSYIVSGANTLTFDDADATAGLTVSRGTANLISTPVALTDNLATTLTNAARVEISGQLSGSGQLQLSRVDTTSTAVRISGNNSAWAGGVQLAGGGGAWSGYANLYSTPLEVAHASALGTGTITGVAGGSFGAGGHLSNQTGGTLTLANNINGRMAFSGDDFVLNGTISASAGAWHQFWSVMANITLPNGFSQDWSLDAGALPGTKTLTLLGASVGDITNVGTGGGSGNLRIEFHHDDAFGTDLSQAVAGGALTLIAANGPRALAKNFTAGWTVDGAGILALTGNTAGYSVFKNGTGLLVLSGTNSLTGYASLNNGVMRLASATALPGAHLYLGTGVSNAALELTPQSGDFARPLATSGAGTVSWSNYADGGFSAYGGSCTVSLSLGGTPNAQLVWANNGFVGINNALVLGSAHADSAIEFRNPIGLTGGSQGAGMRRVRVVDNPDSTGDYAVMSGTISSTHTAAGLIKQGDGTLVLTAPNTYIGPTQVAAGTLLVNNSHTGGAAYTISPGATLGGTGTIGIGTNTATWQAGTGPEEANRGGRVSPGASIGTLTLNGNASLQNYAVYVADLNATTLQSDLLQVNGNLTLGANLIVRLGDWLGDPTGQAFTFLAYTGTLTGTPAWTVDTTGTGWTGGSVNQVGQTFVLGGLVPEPATLGLVALGGALALLKRQRKP